MRRSSSACDFPGRCLPRRLLEELLSETAQTVHVDGDDLIFDHMYIERRMTPLNLYLRTTTRGCRGNGRAGLRAVHPRPRVHEHLRGRPAAEELRRDAPRPRDLLRLRRALPGHRLPLSRLPQATNLEDEMRGEAWFYVADNDVFPETFINFLAFSEAQQAPLSCACTGRY